MSESWQRLYYLGGGVSSRTNWSRAFLQRLIAVILITAVTMLVFSTTRQVGWLIPGGIAAAVVWFGPTLRNSGGDQVMAVGHDWMGRRIRQVLGWDRYVPDREDSPPAFGRVAVMGVSAEEGKPELAVIEHFDDGYFSAVLRLNGSTIGLVDLGAQEYQAQQFGQFLRALAERGVVDQVDLAQRAFPGDRSGHDAWRADHQPKDPRLAGILDELASLTEDSTDSYAAWMVIRMPVHKIRELVTSEGAAPTTEALANAAFDMVGQVGRLAQQHGLSPAFGVPPRSLGAMLRHLYNPDHGIDDLEGIDKTWDGIPAYELDHHGRALSAEGWLHSVGDIPHDGWPVNILTPRFLEDLVIGTRAKHRLIVAQFPVVRAHQATERALVAATAALADKRSKLGQVSAGIEDKAANASQWMLGDITNGGASGVLPTLRVLVSAKTRRELNDARADVERVARGAMGCLNWHWRDHDHARAMVTVAPLGRGVKR